jgi:hypothetical protein
MRSHSRPQSLIPKAWKPTKTNRQGTTTVQATVATGLSAKGHPHAYQTLTAAAEAFGQQLEAAVKAAVPQAFPPKNLSAIYIASYAAPHEQMVAVLRGAEAMLPWDALREAALLRTAPGPAAFLARRGAALRSAAAVAAAGWLAGVGDRHQANLLIEVRWL